MSRLILPRPIFPRPFLWIPKLEFAPGYPCCCSLPCPCGYCTGSTPLTIQMIISGITDGSCGSCNGFNETYILTAGTGAGACSGCCFWWYDLAPTICGVAAIYALVNASDEIRVLGMNTCSGTRRWGFKKTSADMDCASWNSYSIPPDGHFLDQCNTSAATCLLTAL
ncbi:hypothetical protein LCGC14_0326460 [marine sediment metagenome]|uniref:Uncharacterized protein n=1 Tax=marine sediment metagenome TaxID=412755 RepID=A0A0F9TNJ0_9ZZZZ